LEIETSLPLEKQMLNLLEQQTISNGGVAQLVERRASNRKVTKPRFLDSRCGSASLCPWENHFMLFSTLGPSSLPVVASHPDERHANKIPSTLEWYDRHRAVYNIWF